MKTSNTAQRRTASAWRGGGDGRSGGRLAARDAGGERLPVGAGSGRVTGLLARRQAGAWGGAGGGWRSRPCFSPPVLPGATPPLCARWMCWHCWSAWGWRRARAGKQGRFARAGLTDYARDVLASVAQSAFGGLRLVFADIRWREMPRGGGTARVAGLRRRWPGRGAAAAAALRRPVRVGGPDLPPPASGDVQPGLRRTCSPIWN